MNKPFFSVIIPTYNRAHVIKRAVKSVLAQSYKNFELIIVDDGSVDETSIALEEYGDINIIRTSNQGVSTARNLGVQNSCGEWLAFLDSDDEWLEDKLKKQYDFIQTNSQYPLVHGDEIWIRNGKRVNPKNKHQKGGGDQFERSLELCLISPSCVALKRSLFDEMGGFREDFEVCEDFDLWLKVTSKNQIGYIDDFLIKKYGGHEDQLSQKYFGMDEWRVKSILELKGLKEEQQKLANKVAVEKLMILSQGFKKHGKLSKASEFQSLLNGLI